MSKIRRRIILSIFTFLIFHVNTSLAYCPDPEPRIQVKFTRSEVAFIGKVVSSRDVTEKDDEGEFISGVFYRLEVKKLFRGPEKKFIEIYEDSNSARMSLDVGHTYLVFIEGTRDGRLQGFCDDAKEVPETEINKTISKIQKIIENINSGANGTIRGFIGDGGDNGGGGGCCSKGLKGIHFVIEGEGKIYKAVSDKDGWFFVSVPAGIYTVECAEAKLNIYPTIYSYDDPHHVEVKAGGGADLEFVKDLEKNDRYKLSKGWEPIDGIKK